MGRHRPSGSYGHAIVMVEADCYRLSWTVDRYYPDSRLRHPRRATRHADLAGAQRFAKRWGLTVPETPRGRPGRAPKA